MRAFASLALMVTLVTGCRSVRQAEVPTGPQVRILTYNINWGGPRPDVAAQILRQSKADVVCLQETTPEWEQYLRRELAGDYPFAEFRNSQNRAGGGLAFLSRLPAHEIAYIPSETGWFDGWIMKFETACGPVQILNVHLRPPVSDSGSWVSGYLFTRSDRVREMERFFGKCQPGLPTMVAGDFNDGEKSAVVGWLEGKGLVNALPQFDYRTPTWEWKTSVVKLHRRMDHVLYSRELHCCSARVLRAGASDHFPVEAVFTATGTRGTTPGDRASLSH
ncbi:MAG TPA: endonuclease/exonuclease/phosphatase family protein [Candidatus Eisenbacteria bacterium]|nr:endonuclease/exonuclease/phosphatase family protein [Candidatus Eisenbacteria bacterium]